MDALSRKQQDALDALVSWLGQGRIAALTGFPGVGKTEVSRRLQASSPEHGLKAVEVEAPAEGAAGLEDMLEHVAAQAEVEAFTRLVPAKRVHQLGQLLAEPVLLVIEEAHRLFTAEGALDHRLAPVVRALARPGRGRLLLVMNRVPETTRDTERVSQVDLGPMQPDEAAMLLDRVLSRVGLNDAVPLMRRAEVVRRLGHNPRAIIYLVAALRRAPLDELLGQASEDWAAVEPHIAASLVEKLERDLLAQIVADLDSETASWLRALSVLRQAIREPDLHQLAPNDAAFNRMRAALVDRHLLDHRQERYRVEPLAREVALSRLAAQPDQHEAAHGRAAGLYTRHFTVKQVVAGHEHDFVEARYHLALSQNLRTLGEVAQRFVGYLGSEITWVAPRPRTDEQRDVRILTLAALMDAGVDGPGSLWFHLAKLLMDRARGNDLELARTAARKACGSRAIPDAWMVHLRLEAEAGVSAMHIERIARLGIGHHLDAAALYVSAARFLELAGAAESGLALLREGMARIPADKGLVSLYQLAGELLTRKEDVDGALALLRKGIAKVPADQNLFALYRLAAELLTRKEDVDGALTLLREGMAQIPATQSLVALYQLSGELLTRKGDVDGALALLREGMDEIPADKSLVSLYQLAGELLVRKEDVDGALTLLREGMATVPADKSPVSLYQLAGELLVRKEDVDGALALLREGMAKVPANQNLIPLYQLAGELLARKGDEDGALALLRAGLAKIPANQNPVSLYQLAGELLTRKGDLDGANALLLAGLKRVTAAAGGTKLAEDAASLALCAGSPRAIMNVQEYLLSKGGYDLQVALCRVLLAEAEDRWAEAADLAAEWKSLAVPFATLIGHHALALISMGRPVEALQVLDESAARAPGTLIWAWLEALAAVHAGDTHRAATTVARLPPEHRPTPTVDGLLSWWARPRRVAEQHPSYAFPRLPPGCTGRPTVLVYPPDGSGVVLDTPRLAAPPAHPRWLSSESWNASRIDQVLTPGSRVGVHVLGSFDRRITFYNQQVRALLSVRAMYELGRLKAGTRVAVIGGGGAGVTAALAAHLLGAEVHLYEAAPLLLHRQSPADHRLLHPHAYDWPERPLSEDRAQLPILDWEAGRASDVVGGIDQQFRKQFPAERIHCNREVVHIEGDGARGFTLSFADGPPATGVNIVLLAVGFGSDGAVVSPPVPGDTTPGYWDPSDGLAMCAGRPVVVGGAGDGGLIDAVRAAIRGFQHHTTLRAVLDHEEGLRLAEAMLAIDRAAWEEKRRTGAAPEDLFTRYTTQLKPSDEMLVRVRALPVNASSVSLVSSAPGLFRLETALVNRLMVFLLERAGRITLIGGKAEFRPDGTCIVRLRGGREKAFPGALLVLRRGPDPSYLSTLFPEAAAWLVPTDRRVEELELTRNLDIATWRFWRDRSAS